MSEFKVKFVKGQGEQGKLLKGAGTIEISDDEVVLTRSEISGWFGKTPAETVTVKLNQIANVGENANLKCVQFCEYPAGKYSGTPNNVFQFSMVDKSEKADLLELLPKQVSEEVTLKRSFTTNSNSLRHLPFLRMSLSRSALWFTLSWALNTVLMRYLNLPASRFYTLARTLALW